MPEGDNATGQTATDAVLDVIPVTQTNIKIPNGYYISLAQLTSPKMEHSSI